MDARKSAILEAVPVREEEGPGWQEVLDREISQLRAGCATTISQEIRTRLTVILLSAQLLEIYNHQWTVAESLKYIQRIQDAVREMNLLLNETGVMPDKDYCSGTSKSAAYKKVNKK
jgi:signal transduction histidine kinase